MAEKNRQNASGRDEPWRLKDIQKLLDLLIEREITEFEMEKDGVRIRVHRGDSRPPAPAATPAVISPTVLPLTIPGMASPSALAPAVSAATPNPAEPNAAGTAASVPAESSDSLYIIKSPLVGTFYRSPSPNAEPFVEPGDAVRVGQVLCIIEAMKLMNEIESETGGEIVRIYVENGEPVEYGQSLFAIKPSLKR